MTTETLLSIAQIVIVPLGLAVFAWLNQRSSQRNAVMVAQITSQAEQQEATAAWSEKVAHIASDMLAPMEAQLKKVTAENLLLLQQQDALTREMQIQQTRHAKAEAELRKQIEAQTVRVKALTEKLAALERVGVMRQEEIEKLKNENERLSKKINAIKQEVQTRPFAPPNQDTHT